tara:strand:- start:277 stop:816 length:540 start_codon:yes stop_codon:yes gene_type:complete
MAFKTQKEIKAEMRAKGKKDRADRKKRNEKLRASRVTREEFDKTVKANRKLKKAGKSNQTKTVKERRTIKENIEKNKERNKKNVKVKPSSPTQSDASKSAPKKFDYKNKSKTGMSNSKGKRNARGRSSSDIAKDPSFMKNTSKGKYLRGIHAALLRQGMASGGAVKKLSTKPSAGNKWN